MVNFHLQKFLLLMYFSLNILLHAFFVYAILTNCTKNEAPFIIGCTLGSIGFFGGSLTGGRMNPARSLGPALIMGGTALKQVWLFIVAPLLGACGSVAFYKFFNCKKGEKKQENKEEELVELANTK